MKKTVISIICLLLTHVSWAQSYDYFVVERQNGDAATLPSEGLRITFDNGVMTLTPAGGEPVEMSLAELSRMFFSEHSNGIESVEHERDTRMYTVDGKPVDNSIRKKGVYVVITNGKARKVVVE